MKKTFILLLVPICCIMISATFSCAEYKALTNKQINNLFSGRTMTVTDPTPSKKSKESKFEVHTGADGLVKVEGETGSTQTRVWSIKEDGVFCYSRSITRRRGGATCGYITSGGGGTYYMYPKKGTLPSSRVITVRKSGLKHVLIFSNFR